MLFGIDLTPTYPYLALLVILLVIGTLIFLLWRLIQSVANSAKTLAALVKQVGMNGDSSLRQELTALKKQADDMLALLQKKSKEDKEAIARQDVVLSEQDVTLAQLKGMVNVFEKAMNEMGLDKQLRTLVEAYVKKDIATTTLNVIQANAQNARDGGVDILGENKVDVGNDLGGGNKTELVSPTSRTAEER